MAATAAREGDYPVIIIRAVAIRAARLRSDDGKQGAATFWAVVSAKDFSKLGLEISLPIDDLIASFQAAVALIVSVHQAGSIGTVTHDLRLLKGCIGVVGR